MAESNAKEAGRNYPMGINLVEQDKCPKGARNPMACFYCTQGHMLECHYPLDCSEAECSHLVSYE